MLLPSHGNLSVNNALYTYTTKLLTGSIYLQNIQHL